MPGRPDRLSELESQPEGRKARQRSIAVDLLAMCGFVLAAEPPAAVSAAARYVRRRGPDLETVVSYRGLCFLHCLLSLTRERRPQPFVSACGDVLAIYNGEIYNAETFGAVNADGDCILPLYLAHGPAFVRLLDGEFAIVIVDFRNDLFITCTDTFATKPLWTGQLATGPCAASYESALRALGAAAIEKQRANCIRVYSLSSGDRLYSERVTTFQLDQYKSDYSDWMAAFRQAVQKRSAVVGRQFVALSSGYDSGAIACELTRQGASFTAYSIMGSENEEVLRRRHARMRQPEVIPVTEDLLGRARMWLRDECEAFQYAIVRQGQVRAGEFVADDEGAAGLSLISRVAAAAGHRICISGQGGDEIVADYGGYGKRLYPHSFFGGRFPEDLKPEFPWPSFFASTQLSYLGKEECVLGGHGIEGRYPFLDRRLVQEFLSLKVDLKNERYKAPIGAYLDEQGFPYAEGEKIGFSVSSGAPSVMAQR